MTKNNMRLAQFRVLPFLIPAQMFAAGWATAQESPFNPANRLPADVSAMAVSGPSGGLTIPDGRTLSDGTVALGFNNYLDPRFSKADRGENYLFGIGLFPHVEFSGRLANHPADTPFGALVRDLSANVKLSVPNFFPSQPDIALGINDVGGGAQFFRSKYIAASQSYGPVRATIGAARGEAYLDGLFGGAELALGNTGFSLLAERNNDTNHAGLRYGSRPIAALGHISVVATAQRSFGARALDGAKFDRTTFAVNLLIPFGDRARAVNMPAPASSAPRAPAGAYGSRTAEAPSTSTAPASVSTPAAVAQAPLATTGNTSSGTQPLQQLQAALEKAGLERVRVGLAGDKLVIEYENHRYNQNEVDAIGIALGLGARLAPASVQRIGVITKKAGLALYETALDPEWFRSFLNKGAAHWIESGLEVRMRPADNQSVQWVDRAEGKRGYSRILVEPVIKSFVGTEYGTYDYSLAASTQAFVPVWKGAELAASYVTNVSDSGSVRNGPFSYAHQRSGVKTATLNQTFWIMDNVLNTTSAGKFRYDYHGIQNETTLFVPGSDDQARLQYTRLRYSDAFFKQTAVNAGAFYRWNYQPLNTWVEVGYSQYVENDRGPSIRVSRWFGDVQAQVYLRRSEEATFGGFQLAFPLTPRRGMRPGITHIEGPGQFAYGLETRVASRGSANHVTRGIAEEIPLAYSARSMLLNQGRVGREYMFTQLPRMREAALLYASID